MAHKRTCVPARRRKTDAEILAQLETEPQAVIDAALAKIKILVEIEEARCYE